MKRLRRAAVEEMMEKRPDATLEAALEVFEVFASGSLTDEVYILDDVGGKCIAIAPTALKEKYRRGGAPALLAVPPQQGAGGPESGVGRGQRLGAPARTHAAPPAPARRAAPAEGG